MSIFTLVGDVFVNNEKANKSIADTDKKGQGLGKTFQKSIKTVGKFGAVLGGAALAGGAAMIALGKKTGDAADRLLDMSSITGMSTDELQKWEKVSTVAGVSADAISNISQKFTKTMDALSTGTGKASEAAAELGLSYESLNEMNADERMNALTAALQGVSDPTERARIGTDLLGGAWKEMAPILDVGADRLKKVKDNANIISNEDLNQANEFRIKMDQMKEKALDFAQKLAVKFMPILNKVFDWFMNNSPMIEATFNTVMNAIGSAIEFLIPIITGFLIPAFMKISGWVKDNLPAIKEGFKKAFDFIKEAVQIFADLFQAIWDKFGDAILEKAAMFWEFLKESFERGFAIIKGIIEFFTSIFKGDWQAAWDKFKEIIALVWEQIKANIELALKLLKGILETGFNLIKTVIEGIWNGITGIIDGVWEGIKGIVSGGINWIIDKINGMIVKINKISFKLPFSDEEIGVNIATIPRLQTGGTITKAGRVLVGEAGPEELQLPEGASIIPLNKQGRSGGITVIIEAGTVVGQNAGEELAEMVVETLQDRGVFA